MKLAGGLIMKKIIVVLFAISLLINCSPKYANAEESYTFLDSKEKTFNFDLSMKYQKYSFIDEDGLLTTVSIRGSAGERTISYLNNKIRASFKVFIDNNIITSAYDKNCSSDWWTITNDVLVKNSNYQVTYTISLKRLFLSTTRYLQANLSNGSLSVTFN